MPSWEAVSANGWPSAVNVTGVLCSAVAREDSRRTACDSGIPPTSTPAIVVPAASSVCDPAKASPRSSEEHAKDHPEEDGPAQGNPAGGLAHARAVDRRIAAHRTEDFSGAAHGRELALAEDPGASGHPGERLKPLP